MIVQNYARFIDGEHLETDKSFDLFESNDYHLTTLSSKMS